MFNINYGIVLVRAGADPTDIANVLHFVGYEEPPCEIDFKVVREELESDQELGFVGQMEGLELAQASPEIVDYFSNEVGPIEE